MIYASKIFLFSTSIYFCNVFLHFIQRCKTVCLNSTKFYSFVKNSLAFSCKFFSTSRSFNHSCFNRIFSLTHALSITFKLDKFADQSIFLMSLFLRFSSHCFETLMCVDALFLINHICLSKCFLCVSS